MRFAQLAGLTITAYLLNAIPCFPPALAQTPQTASAPLSAAQEQALKPGDSFKECVGNCPEMIVVPAGSFMMGSPTACDRPRADECRSNCAVSYEGASPYGSYMCWTNPTCRDMCTKACACPNNGDQQPQHKVTIATPFAVSKFELTFAEWDACVADHACRKADDEFHWGRGRQPVINVSWLDAQQFVAWLVKKTGKPYRLLSEAEYEYAARAGTTTAYPWGDEIKFNGQPMANCSGCGSRWDAQQRTAPVGSFLPNKFGLQDMVGNVWEWTDDCWHDSYNGAPADAAAWTARRGCTERVIRGGAFDQTPQALSVTTRHALSADGRHYTVGFRVARKINSPEPAAPVTPAPTAVAPTITVTALSATQEQAVKPKETFRECSKCPVMMVVPAGSFIRGSPASEPGRDHDEGPQHRVTLARQFAIGQFEVTFDEWDACVADGGCNGYRPSDEGWGRGSRPVINVSWDYPDIRAYLEWLTKKTGKPYRLLSEAEYEYAARAGTTTAYPWGDEIKFNGKPVASCSGCGSQWDRRQTAPVGSFPPNKFGLYDMVGNVWEWTDDCWNGSPLYGSYNGVPTDGSAWTGGDCSYRVLRGGSWRDVPEHLRSAARWRLPPGQRENTIGFRVARTLLAP